MEGQEQGEHTSFLCTLRTGQQEVRQSELEPLAVGWPRAADTMRLAGAAGSLGGNAITWGSGELQLAAEIYLLFISVVPWKLQQLGSSCLSSAILAMGQQLPGWGHVGTRREVHGACCARFTWDVMQGGGEGCQVSSTASAPE